MSLLLLAAMRHYQQQTAASVLMLRNTPVSLLLGTVSLVPGMSRDGPGNSDTCLVRPSNSDTCPVRSSAQKQVFCLCQCAQCGHLLSGTFPVHCCLLNPANQCPVILLKYNVFSFVGCIAQFCYIVRCFWMESSATGILLHTVILNGLPKKLLAA